MRVFGLCLNNALLSLVVGATVLLGFEKEGGGSLFLWLRTITGIDGMAGLFPWRFAAMGGKSRISFECKCCRGEAIVCVCVW